MGPVTVMVSSQSDLDMICRLANRDEDYFKNVMMSRLYFGYDSKTPFSLAGPVVGAPYAVMLLETIVAWGAKKIIFIGWCGAISPDVSIGDIIIPTGAIIDEGTSKHYDANEYEIAMPSPRLTQSIGDVLRERNILFHEGTIWSTDAIYRETPRKVSYYQGRDVLAVEMEMSALFTVGKFRNAEVSGILVVSDELSTLTWHPGFNDERFRQSRRNVAEVMNSLCQTLQTQS